ncbi:MAG: TonB-dependent receptor [Reichenbachiella sp.]
MKTKLLGLLRMTIKLSTYGLLFQLFCMSVLNAYNGNAQYKSVNEIIIEEAIVELSIKESFDLIESNSDLNMLYLEKDLNSDIRINLTSEIKRSVYDILMEVSKKSGLKFRQVNNGISVSRISKKDLNQDINRVEILADITITGKISDENGEGLPGASIIAEGTSSGTTSDLDGNYKVAVSEDAVLVVSFIGYTTQKINIAGRSSIDVQMVVDAEQLEEVVVVGYGTARKRDLTGATSSVKSADIEKRPLVRLEQAMQGIAPGVFVSSANGQPGKGLDVKIRGASSITGGTGPLYVVDGFIGADIQGISPSDIESMEILKDASATAIYGSRGSNGVVLITTKTGSDGEIKVDLGAWFSFGKAQKQLDLLSAADFARVVNTKDDNSGVPHTFTDSEIQGFETNGTDWQEELLTEQLVQNYDVALSGGSSAVKYRISMNHLDEPGIIINQGYKRTTLRSNLDFKLSDNIDLKVNLLGLQSKGHNNRYGGGLGDPISQATIFDPTTPVKADDGSYNERTVNNVGSIGFNPIAQANNGTSDYLDKNFSATTSLTWKITEQLSFNTTNAYSTWSNLESRFDGDVTEYGSVNGQSRAYRQTNQGYRFLNSNYLNYKNTFGDHTVSLTALYEQQKSERMRFRATAVGLATDALGYYNLGLGETQIVESSSGNSLGYENDALQSFMGRINYNFKEKYLLTASYRYDGSSRLDDQYSGFPSIGLAWRLSEEGFMSNTGVDLKLRASYGETGNQTVPVYSTIARITVGQPYYYDGVSPSVSTPLGAPASSGLKWEVTKQTDIGIDASFLEGRVTLSADWYNRDITDLLFERQASYYAGGGNYFTNLGELNNTGFEFALGGTPVNNSKVKWNSNLTLSFNKNKVVDLGDLGDIAIGGSQASQISYLTAGRPLGEMRGYEFLGTWKTSEAAEAAEYGMVPGDPKYTDVNGDKVYNEDDIIPIGNGTPDVTWGFNNDVIIGAFSINVLLTGTAGNDIYSRTMAYTWGGQGQARHPTNAGALNQWTAENETDVPADNPTGKNFLESSRYIYDGSYASLRNVSIAYELPSSLLEKVKMRSAQVYVSGQNLVTITDYPGFDPEISNSNQALTQGIEHGVIPNARRFTVGVRIGL